MIDSRKRNRGYLELVSKLLPAAIGCKARGTALSAKRVLDVIQYASEPFPPPALPTTFSPVLATKSVLKPVLASVSLLLACLSSPFFFPAVLLADPIKAFPDAQGWAAYTAGGRGGKIIRVTNLKSRGPGSFAAAVRMKIDFETR